MPNEILGILVPKMLFKADLEKAFNYGYAKEDRWIEQNGLPYDMNSLDIREDLMEDDSKPYKARFRDLMGLDENDEPTAEVKLDPDKCQFILAKGKQCGRDKVKGHEFCFQHMPKEDDSQGKGGKKNTENDDGDKNSDAEE